MSRKGVSIVVSIMDSKMQNTISSVAFFKVSLLPANFILMIGSAPLLRVECISCFARTLVRYSGNERQRFLHDCTTK